MSYEERGQWVYLVVAVATYGAYLAVVLGRAGTTPLVEVPYVAAMLWAVGVTVALSVIGRVAVEIAVEIARPGTEQRIDVRDKEIERRGEYVGGVVLAVGMLVPLGLAMAEVEHFWIANAIYAVLVLSTLVATPVKLIAYRRGF